MTLEMVPLVLGGVLALLGLALLFDAWTPDEFIVRRERRRHPRIERNRSGEALIGLGVLGMAAAFLGRDTWPYTVVSVIAGSVLLLWGALLNWSFLGASIGNRGALRRRDPADEPAQRTRPAARRPDEPPT
jgi:hypothetical protein